MLVVRGRDGLSFDDVMRLLGGRAAGTAKGVNERIDSVSLRTRAALLSDQRMHGAGTSQSYDQWRDDGFPVSHRTFEDEVADELGLNPAMTALQVREARRRFAKRNHPDCVDVGGAARAAARMALANTLVDAALSKAR